MNQLIFVLGAAMPTAWLLWRRGWLDRKRRYGVVLAIVCAFYFVLMRSLPERGKPPVAHSDESMPSIEAPRPQAPYMVPLHGNRYPTTDDFTLARRPR